MNKYSYLLTSLLSAAAGGAIGKYVSPAVYQPVEVSDFSKIRVRPNGICYPIDAGVSTPGPTDAGCWQTEAVYSVRAVAGSGLDDLRGRGHDSPTRAETITAITGLIQSVVLPKFKAQWAVALQLTLNGTRVYPEPDVQHVTFAGIHGDMLSAHVEVPSLVEGVAPLVDDIVDVPPPAALAAVLGMASQYLVPAVNAELNLQ